MKTNNTKFTFISIACLTIGILMLLIQKKWIVIYWNFGTVESDAPLQKKDASTRKKVRIYFWKDDKFKHEDTVVIWSGGNNNENLKHLINAWLATQLDEKIFTKKIDLEYVALSSQDQDAFISLNQGFAWDDWSIFRKYQLIESLLKTIKDAAPEIRFINMLVNGKILEDSHLSFLQQWPIDGFRN